MIVAAGVTGCVPPVGPSVNVLVSRLSEITTCVAFVAVTVSVEELPVVMAVGVATIVTVGALGAVTVIVVLAVVVPPGPVAVAVYVVVAAGVTACVPPVAANVNVVLSVLSEITTWVALLAATLRVEESPAITVLGFAVMVTVGSAVGGGVLAEVVLPQEVNGASDTATTEISVAGHIQRRANVDGAQKPFRL